MAAVASSSSSIASLPVLLMFAAVAGPAAGARPTIAAGLAERLEGSQQCWEVLMDIRSCTGEIILFFLNGEAYLGPGCCRAIRVVEQRCWAADAVLSAIGFTPEEGDMLKGYCDAGHDDDVRRGGENDGEGHHRPIGGSQPAPPPTNLAALDDVAATDGTTAPAAAAAAGRRGLVAAVRHKLDG